MASRLPLYTAALEAGNRFHDQVIRQFGRKNAGDMRYRTDLHDQQTISAGLDYLEAAEKWRNAVKEARMDADKPEIKAARAPIRKARG